MSPGMTPLRKIHWRQAWFTFYGDGHGWFVHAPALPSFNLYCSVFVLVLDASLFLLSSHRNLNWSRIIRSWSVKLILSLKLNTLKGELSLPYKLKWITDSCFSGFVFLSTAACILPASVSCCSPGLLATTLHCCAPVCSPFLSYSRSLVYPTFLPHPLCLSSSVLAVFPPPSFLFTFCAREKKGRERRATSPQDHVT